MALIIEHNEQVAKTREYRSRIRPFAERESATKALQSFITHKGEMTRKGMYTLEIANNLIQSNNYVTESLFKRIPPETCRGMSEGGRKLVQASLICRAEAEGSGGTTRSVPEDIYGGYSRIQRVICSWAHRDGCWEDTPESNLLRQGYGHNSDTDGTEARVFYDDKGQNVVKTISFQRFSHFELMMDRIAIHNAVFPETRMSVLGFGIRDDSHDADGYVIKIRQPYIKGRIPTIQEIDAGMEEVGYDRTDFIAPAYISRTGNSIITDIDPKNAIISDSGLFYVVDDIASIAFFDPDLAKPEREKLENILPGKNGSYNEALWKKILGDEYRIKDDSQKSAVLHQLRNFGKVTGLTGGRTIKLDNPEKIHVNIDGKDRSFYRGDVLYGDPHVFIKNNTFTVPCLDYDDKAVADIKNTIDLLVPNSIPLGEFLYNKEIVGLQTATHYGGKSLRDDLVAQLRNNGRIEGLLNDRYLVQVDPDNRDNVLVSNKDNVGFLLWTKDFMDDEFGKLSPDEKRRLASGETVSRGNEKIFFNIDKGRIDRVFDNPIRLSLKAQQMLKEPKRKTGSLKF